MGAQAALNTVTFSFAVLGFVLAFLYQARCTPKGERDWVEILARSLFMLLQSAIWGGVIGFIVLHTVFGVNFGGTK